MKRAEYKWIDFLSGSNVLNVSNEKDFNKFKSFLKECGLIEILGKDTLYSDWQHLAQINGKNENIFLFEYNNYKGLTWWDNAKESTNWYGEPPIEMSAIDEFFDKKSEQKTIENEEKSNDEIGYDYD